jgi:hypothetical protein
MVFLFALSLILALHRIGKAIVESIFVMNCSL